MGKKRRDHKAPSRPRPRPLPRPVNAPALCRECGHPIGTYGASCDECSAYLVKGSKVMDKITGRLEDAGFVDATKSQKCGLCGGVALSSGVCRECIEASKPTPPTQHQALDVLLSVTAELSGAGCPDAAVMGAVLMLGANSAGLMAASSPRFLADLRDKPSSQPLAGQIYRACQALLELYEAGVAPAPKERRDLTGVIVVLRDALGEIPAAFEDSLMCLENKVRYLAPEQQGANLWEALGVILEHHVPQGVDGHDVAVRIFNGVSDG